MKAAVVRERYLQRSGLEAPPANSVGPVLRAGLTEALVTGIRKT
jgi:hypothetical protein